MEQMLPSFNDPLFSILMIITLMLITALATYVWGIYVQKRKRESLASFLEKFDGIESIFDNHLIDFQSNRIKPMEILAKAFENSGEYHKAIDIYLYLIKNSDALLSKKGLLQKLGELYLRAGFIERSKGIFLEILKEYPRSPNALHHLAIVYELLHQYDKAKEVLEPLEILGEDTEALRDYLDFEILIGNPALSLKQKIIELQTINQTHPLLYRNALLYAFRHDYNLAWKMVECKKIHEIIDILWMLPKSKLDLDIIYTNGCLQTIYYLKGYIDASPHLCNIFHIDILASAKRSGNGEGDLLFEYRCKKCQHAFPISFERCPNCMNINSMKIEVNIAKKQQTSNALL
ncbi:MAG: hypothetical protein JXQ76_11315 [Campylobacterales bacterium]|nr:hypothetical protein [Campylobacterales bacterium]